MRCLRLSHWLGLSTASRLARAKVLPIEYADPQTFDIRRTPTRQLAFGLGVHMCLGQLMARTETALALRRLMACCPGIRLTDAVPVGAHFVFSAV